MTGIARESDDALPLFPSPDKRLPPHSGGETSEAAAVAIKPDANGLRRAVLKYLTARGPEGATDAEMQEALSMGGSTERPRRRELVQAGLVEDSGETRVTLSGRAAVVWRVVPELGACLDD